jgi:hypothetical protein
LSVVGAELVAVRGGGHDPAERREGLQRDLHGSQLAHPWLLPLGIHQLRRRQGVFGAHGSAGPAVGARRKKWRGKGRCGGLVNVAIYTSLIPCHIHCCLTEMERR